MRRLLGVCLLCLGAARAEAAAAAGARGDESAPAAEVARLRRSGGYPKFPVAATGAAADVVVEGAAEEGKEGGGGGECGTRLVAHQPRRAGLPYPKIVGGAPVPYGAYPWQVQIQVREGAGPRRRFQHHCGGAVLSARLVVSAAHCLQGVEAARLRVVAGEHRLRERDSHERALAVEQVLTHPLFRRAGPYSNDIGLLVVGGEWAFSSHVRSICLPPAPPSAAPPPGAWCTVTGWGAQRGDDPDSLSEVLRAAAVPLLDAATCRNDSVYGGRSQSILDSMLCAGLVDGGADACGGDSGGPLACEVHGRFVLTGIVSWGDGCAKKNRPGVYTRISHYTDWIQASMKKLGL